MLRVMSVNVSSFGIPLTAAHKQKIETQTVVPPIALNNGMSAIAPKPNGLANVVQSP